MSASEISGKASIAIAKGIGGTVALYENELMISRNGWVNHALRLVSGATPSIERIIPIRHISGVAIVKPLILNEYFLIAYPGSPPATGYQLHDAVSENAIMMNFFDNRDFYYLKEELDVRLDYYQRKLLF
jgi:hypothetical protein